jgi:PAS domain S-box-containing protein
VQSDRIFLMTQSTSSLRAFGGAGRHKFLSAVASLDAVVPLTSWRRRIWTIRQWLTITALFILVPCFVIAHVALEAYLRADRLELQTRVESEANQLRDVIGREIDHMRNLGLHLARIEPLLRAEPDRLKSVFVASLGPERDHDLHIGLADESGRQLLNTRAATDAALPRVADMAGLELVVRERRPVVRLIPRGNVSGRSLYAVIVPVLRDDRVERFVFMNRTTDHLLNLIGQQLPAGWHATIFEPSGRAFPASGSQSSPPTLPVDAAGGSPLTRVSNSGTTVTSYIKIDKADWTIAVTVATQDVATRQLPLFIALQAAVVALSLLVAGWATRRMVKPIALVERMAIEIGAGSPPTLPDIRIAEIRRVAETLVKTSGALQQSRERLYSVITSASDAIVCTDRQGRVTLFNDAARSMFACADIAAMGRPIGEFLDETSIPASDRHSAAFECTGRRASGDKFAGEVSVARSADDQEYHFSFIIRDITKQRLATAQNARLAVVVASSADAIVSLGNDHTVLSWNPGAERIFGYSAEEIVGRSYLAIIPDAVKDEYLRNCERIGSGGALSLTVSRLHKDGRLVPVEISSAPLRDERGVVIGISSVLRDVTEKVAAAALANQLAAIVDASADAIVGLAPDGTISTWNPAARRLFDYSADEVVGKSLDVLLSDDELDKLSDKLERVRRAGFATVETERRRKDGTPVAVSVTAAPIRDAREKITGYAVVYRDVTESRRHDQQMRIVMRELSHRAKNLLAVISAMARSMSSSTTDITVFVESFSARIYGLARSHDLLVKKEWTNASLRSLTEAQLQPFMYRGGNRLLLNGGDIAVNPAAAQMIGLALHELATNAAKHGALTTDSGSVSITWSVDNDELQAAHLEMTWRESGGPRVVEPSRTGFGREVLEEMIAESLDGSTELSFPEGGIIWRLRVPLSTLQTTHAH